MKTEVVALLMIRACLLLLMLLVLPSSGSAQATYYVADGLSTAVSNSCSPGTTQSFVLAGTTLLSGDWSFVVVQGGGVESVLETGGSICELGLQGTFNGAWNPVVGGCLPGVVPVIMCLNNTVFVAPHVAIYDFHYEYFDGRPTWDGHATLIYA